MTEFLQQYAGLHFTLAIVELALFKVPDRGYIAQPRVLARTTNIDRGIVTVDTGGRVSIGPSDVLPPTAIANPKRTTITQEEYFEQLEERFPGISQKLNAFIDDAATYSVSPDIGTNSMILRWHTDDGKMWNLATITRRGDVWMDSLAHQAKDADLLGLQKQYLANLARLVPGAFVRETPKDAGWYVALGAQHPKCITVDALVEDQARRDGWVNALKEFQSAVMKASNGD